MVGRSTAPLSKHTYLERERLVLKCSPCTYKLCCLGQAPSLRSNFLLEKKLHFIKSQHLPHKIIMRTNEPTYLKRSAPCLVNSKYSVSRKLWRHYYATNRTFSTSHFATSRMTWSLSPEHRNLTNLPSSPLWGQPRAPSRGDEQSCFKEDSDGGVCFVHFLEYRAKEGPLSEGGHVLPSWSMLVVPPLTGWQLATGTWGICLVISQ